MLFAKRIYWIANMDGKKYPFAWYQCRSKIAISDLSLEVRFSAYDRGRKHSQNVISDYIKTLNFKTFTSPRQPWWRFVVVDNLLLSPNLNRSPAQYKFWGIIVALLVSAFHQFWKCFLGLSYVTVYVVVLYRVYSRLKQARLMHQSTVGLFGSFVLA